MSKKRKHHERNPKDLVKKYRQIVQKNSQLFIIRKGELKNETKN